MNAPERYAGVRAVAQARATVILAAHVEAAERLIETCGAVSTAELCGAIGRSRRIAVIVSATLGLRRSDETAEHRREAPVYHARELDAALAAERAWLAARAARSPVATSSPKAMARRVRPPRLAPAIGATAAEPGVPVTLVVLPLADVRASGDVFACSALGARLSAGACVAQHQSALPERHVCRGCPDGRALARRLA